MIDKLLEIDQEMFLALNFEGGAFLDQFFWIVTAKITWIPLYIIIAWAFYKRYGLRNALIGLACLGLFIGAADQICNFFKDVFPKIRPTHRPELDGLVHTINGYRGGLSGTVSAHSAISFTIAIYASLFLQRKTIMCILILWAALVAYSRIYVGVHFPYDLFFGAITGVVMAVTGLYVFRFIARHVGQHVAFPEPPHPARWRVPRFLSPIPNSLA